MRTMPKRQPLSKMAGIAVLLIITAMTLAACGTTETPTVGTGAELSTATVDTTATANAMASATPDLSVIGTDTPSMMETPTIDMSGTTMPMTGTITPTMLETSTPMTSTTTPGAMDTTPTSDMSATATP
ncbi:MAG: hypothetical protein IVW55_06900 [Chloroflexi bacterium]|nr:hypothetical protein [Chloroflexota bacterium]